ncbi:MAG: hypothetical protein AUH78_00220 [Gemmatimonadetes bacterium 13_1_40CM_4_69_8]|nr:MAG: hypothetical protein AUH78_00220 [Gemmatimonadetes bacterium 13_1_40CM_4_69_8]
MLGPEEQAHGLLAGARLRADKHEPAAELRPELQRMLPQSQPPTLRHGEIRDHGVEPLRAMASRTAAWSLLQRVLC